MLYTYAGSFVLAALLAKKSTLVLLVIGVVLLVLGLLRLIGVLRLGRRDNPVLSGVIMIVVGGVAIAVGLVR